MYKFIAWNEYFGCFDFGYNIEDDYAFVGVYVKSSIAEVKTHRVIAHPHLLVRATNERFPPTRGTFRSVLASESHWL